MSGGRVRVLFATDGVFPLSLGGIQRHSRLLAEELARRGNVELTVLHPHAERVFDPALGVDEVSLRPMPARRHYLRELHAYSKDVHAAAMARPDHVVYAQGMAAWHRARDFGARLVVNPHGLEFYQATRPVPWLKALSYRVAHRGILGSAARIVSLGGRLTGIVHRNVPRSESRVVVIPNATAPPHGVLPRDGMVGSPLRCLYVGRLAWNKGIDVLVEAARELEREGDGGFAFTVVGDGPRRAVIERAGLPATVALKGAISDDAVLHALYRSHDVFVLPTRYEGMPTVVLEAMGFGLPVIVTDVGATRDMVDASNGLIVRPGDARDFARALREFRALSDAERSAMSRAGLERLRSRFTWPIVAGRHEELFREVAAEASLRPSVP